MSELKLPHFQSRSNEQILDDDASENVQQAFRLSGDGCIHQSATHHFNGK